jgi:hypothetical protein
VRHDGATETVVNDTPDEPYYSEANVEDMPPGPKELEEMYNPKYHIGEEEEEDEGSDGDDSDGEDGEDDENGEDATDEEEG